MTPVQPRPNSAVTILIMSVGAAAILFLTVAHQPWAGLGCIVVTVALFVTADRRLPRRTAADRPH